MNNVRFIRQTNLCTVRLILKMSATANSPSYKVQFERLK